MSSPNSAYSILLATNLATDLALLDRRLGEVIGEDLKELSQLVFSFLIQPISPATCFQFKPRCQEIQRELGCKFMEFACNQCEPESAEHAPHEAPMRVDETFSATLPSPQTAGGAETGFCISWALQPGTFRGARWHL
jgi:hypothetical protein